MLILGCFFLAGLFSNTTEPVSTLPKDGLVEQVATVKDFLQVQPIENLEELDHIGDATKMVEAKKEIVIFTRANCPPCDRWKRIEQPKFERAGWTVAYCDRHDFAITPHFIIEENGKKYENKGYLPFDKIDEVVK